MTVRNLMGLAALAGLLALSSLGCSAPQLHALYADPGLAGQPDAERGVVVLPAPESTPRIQSEEQPRIPSALAVQVRFGE